MIPQYKPNMTTLITLIANSILGKVLFIITFFFQTVKLLIQSKINDSSFLETLLNNVPAQLIYGLSIIYAVVVVLKRISDFLKAHQINQIEIKLKKELLKQEKLKTKAHENK